MTSFLIFCFGACSLFSDCFVLVVGAYVAVAASIMCPFVMAFVWYAWICVGVVVLVHVW